MLREAFRRPNRPDLPEEDESFDAFMSRRFGSEFARVLGSALVHGIYAADSRELSIRAAFGPVWDAETRGDGSVVKGLYRSRPTEEPGDSEKYDTGGLEQTMKDVAVYSFKDGLETLTEALKHRLEMAPNVQVRTNVEVTGIQPMDGSFEVCIRPIAMRDSHNATRSPPLPVPYPHPISYPPSLCPLSVRSPPA